MRFWDSSALVPLLVHEPSGPELGHLVEGDPDMVLWWATPVECASAIARREREDTLDFAAANAALARLRTLAASCAEVAPGDVVRQTAQRLLRVHPLRGADALQLAAALVLAEHDPGGLGFVCLDGRLGAAAAREGFEVLP